MRLPVVLTGLLLVAVALGQSTPAAGSPERKALMDAIRVPIQRDIGQKVQFKVDWLKVQGNWAFLKGKPIQPGGSDIDYSRTKYAQEVKDGVFGYGVQCLFKKKGSKWTVAKYVLGASDVPYTMWWKEFGAPKKIFDVSENGG